MQQNTKDVCAPAHKHCTLNVHHLLSECLRGNNECPFTFTKCKTNQHLISVPITQFSKQNGTNLCIFFFLLYLLF